MGAVTWILQFLLAIAFVAAGLMKMTTPKERLLDRMEWVRNVTPRGIKAVGLVEILGGLGLVLPAVTGIAPVLTLLAAIGLAVVMLLAIWTHIRMAETPQAVPAVVLFILLVITIIGLITQGRV